MYASLIHQTGDSLRLNRLTHDLLEISETRPEPWNAVALYCDLKGQKEKAVAFVEKSISLNSRHVYSHLLKGRLLLELRQADQAEKCFFHAYSMCKNFTALKGLVECYLSNDKLAAAHRTAKQALKLLPNTTRGLTLLGRVLMKMPDRQPDGPSKARKQFERALQIDRRALEPVLFLADLHMKQGRHAAAIDLLTGSLTHHQRDVVHNKLAEVYVQQRQYTQALAHYHTALSLAPHSVAAGKGLDRLEKIMRGEIMDTDTSVNVSGATGESFDGNEYMR